eukprot:jgi/Picsp_1/510/NSC_00508-R1_dymeclin-like isoform 2
MGNAASEPRDSTEPVRLKENLVAQVYESEEDPSEAAAWLSEVLNEKDEYIQTKKGLLNRVVLEKYVQDIVIGDQKNKRLHKLVVAVGKVLTQASDKASFGGNYALANLVCVQRNILCTINENYASEAVGQLEETMGDKRNVMEYFADSVLHALQEQLGHGVGTAHQYVLLLELMKLLLVMVSTSVSQRAKSSRKDGIEVMRYPFLRYLVQCKHCGVLAGMLIDQWMQSPKPPSSMALYDAAQEEAVSGSSSMYSAAKSLIWMPVHAYSYFQGQQGRQQGIAERSPIADASMLLLLVMSLYHPEERRGDNLFKETLGRLEDSEGFSANHELQQGLPSIDFARLFAAFADRIQGSEATTILLYVIIYGNSGFYNYCMAQHSRFFSSDEIQARTDIDVLLLPILESLLNIEKKEKNEAYLLMIILLILSGEASFAKSVDRIRLKDVQFYKQKSLKNIKLGSLIYIVLLHIAQYNINIMKDMYLLTNTLAILANLAPTTTDLSASACQRMLQTVDKLDKRIERLEAEKSAKQDIQGDEIDFEIQLCSDFLNIVLEVLNILVVKHITSNLPLIYGMLHQRDVLAKIQQKDEYKDLMYNITLVLDFFGSRIDDESQTANQGALTLESVQSIIHNTSLTWKNGSVRESSDLRFTYEEDVGHSEFFMPYIWKMVANSSLIAWYCNVNV